MSSKKKFIKLQNIPEVKKENINVSEFLKTINEQNRLEEQNINVSFQFFDRTNEMFNLGSAEKEWYLSFLDTIQLLSQITKKELFGIYRERFKPHPYQREKVNFKDDLLLDPQTEAYQLRISKGNGRIHGLFIENTYYIRFLDNNHNMYDSEGYGGVQYYDYPKNEYEKLQYDYDIIKAECKEYKEKNVELTNSLSSSFSYFCENCSDCQKSSEVYKKFNF